jgi:integrase
MKTPKVEVKRRGKDGIFWVRYAFNGKREHYSLETADEVKAPEMVEEIKYEIRRGIHQPRKRMIFDNLLELFLQHQKARTVQSSYSRDLTCGKCLLKAFTGRRIDEITHQDLELYMEQRKNGGYRSDKSTKDKPSNVSINHELTMIKHMFNKAVLWKMLPTNQLQSVRCMSVLAFRPRYATEDELAKLQRHASPELWDIIVFQLCMGMRPKELFNLKWCDLDWPQRSITVVQPKNRKPRQIPMNDSVYTLLLKRRQQLSSEYVFPGKNSEKRASIRTAWNAACRRAGINNLHFYDLRKTFCTILATEGFDLRTIMDMSGHSDLESLGPYLALRSEKKRQAVSIFDKLLAEIGPKVDQTEVPREEKT